MIMRKFVLLLALAALPVLAGAQSIQDINRPTLGDLDEVTRFHEGLAAVRKGSQWGFIDQDGLLVIDFRDDLVWQREPDPGALGVGSIPYPRFSDGRCPVMVSGEDGIPLYGFIDTEGRMVIEPEFLNVSEFQNGRAVGIYYKKTFRGKNNFQLNIYDHTFTEVVLNKAGAMVWPLAERENILMNARRYRTPEIQARIIENGLIAVKSDRARWEIRKLDLEGGF